MKLADLAEQCHHCKRIHHVQDAAIGTCTECHADICRECAGEVDDDMDGTTLWCTDCQPKDDDQ